MRAEWLIRWERRLWAGALALLGVALFYVMSYRPLVAGMAELVGAVNQLHQRVTALEKRTGGP